MEARRENEIHLQVASVAVVVAVVVADFACGRKRTEVGPWVVEAGG